MGLAWAQEAVAGPEWLADGVSARARAAVKAHPRFDVAMCRAATGIVALYSGNRLLNRVLNDRGRALFGMLSLYLHALPETAGGGLTAGRLAALCAETAVCSRGRAKAMLAVMRWGGYVEPGGAAGDRRVKPLVPTRRMLVLHRERWRRQFVALALVDDGADAVLARLDEDAFLDRLAIACGTAFRAGFRVLRCAPAFAAIADRDSGALIFFAILAAQKAGQEPPAVAELARRFHVSRAHVLQMLKDAVADGLLERGEGGGAGRLTPAGQAALRDFFAATFAFLGGCGREALRAPPGGRSA